MSRARKERSSVTCRPPKTPTRAALPALSRGMSPISGERWRQTVREVPCPPNVSLAASSRGKRMGREAPKADRVGPQSSGSCAQGSSWGGISLRSPHPGPRWHLLLVLPAAVGAPPVQTLPKHRRHQKQDAGGFKYRSSIENVRGLCLLGRYQRGACPCGS